MVTRKRTKPDGTIKRNCSYLTPGCRCPNCNRWRVKTETRRAQGVTSTNVLDAIAIDGGDDFFEPTKKPAPSVQIPGSPGKLAELASRIEAGEELWHDGDRVFYGEDDE